MLADAKDGKPEVLLMATGSEVSMCVAACERLQADRVAARVVSLPSWELFEHQDRAYRDAVIPPDVVARVAVEKGSILGWTRYTGLRGETIGMRTFGASAPLKELQRRYGFVPENIVAAARDRVARARANGWRWRRPILARRHRGAGRAGPGCLREQMRGDPGTARLFENRVWVDAEAGATQGSFRAFLSDGTLVNGLVQRDLSPRRLALDRGRGRLGRGRRRGAAEVGMVGPDELVLVRGLAGGPEVRNYRVARAPLTCPESD